MIKSGIKVRVVGLEFSYPTLLLLWTPKVVRNCLLLVCLHLLSIFYYGYRNTAILCELFISEQDEIPHSHHRPAAEHIPGHVHPLDPPPPNRGLSPIPEPTNGPKVPGRLLPQDARGRHQEMRLPPRRSLQQRRDSWRRLGQ